MVILQSRHLAIHHYPLYYNSLEHPVIFNLSPLLNQRGRGGKRERVYLHIYQN